MFNNYYPALESSFCINEDRTVAIDIGDRQVLLTKHDGSPYFPLDNIDSYREIRDIDPIFIFEFLDGDNSCYVSIFDSNLVLLCENLQYGEPHYQELIGRCVALDLTNAVARLARRNNKGEESAIKSNRFQTASTAVRKLLAKLACEHALSEPYILNIESPKDVPPLFVQQCGVVRKISGEACIDLFTQRSAELFAGFISSNRMQVSDLSDGVPLDLSCVICMSEFHYAYCFNSSRGDRLIVIFVTTHHTAVMGVYYPESDIVIYNHTANDVMRECKNIASYIGFDARRSFLQNLFGYDMVIKGITKASPPFYVVRERHLGHHLWNELGGIHELLSKNPHLRIKILITAGTESEVYGKIDDIYPALKGRVIRYALRPEQFSDFAHKNNIIPFRYTTQSVNRSTASKIMLASDRTAPATDREILYQARQEKRAIVVLGIRLNDRTLEEPLPFFVATISKLNAICGPLLVVVDGYNAPNRASKLDVSLQNMIEAESEFFTQLTSYLVGLDVILVSNIGKSMSVSIFWAANSDFFVAIWGAGLAKYRWIANLPGVIVSSKWNIEQRADFRIYETSQYMDNPTPVIYPPASIISDSSFDVGGNRTDEPEGLRNFRVNLDGWLSFLDISCSQYRRETLNG